MKGGRAFTKPLPFVLGTNLGQVDYGADPTGMAAALSIGMSIIRDEIPWNFTKGGGITALEATVGSYNSTNIATYASVAATIKAAGMTPLFTVTVNEAPGLCPILNGALVSGNVYTSINVDAVPFVGSIGDSIVLTSPDQVHTQTVVLAQNITYYEGGAISVNSFTANFSYPTGTWVYDTAWVPCTPKHFSDAMAHLVAQTGMQGLNWELLNEPDGGGWNVSETLYVKMLSLAYPAMKAADPTCIIHGLVLASVAPQYFVNGTDYYNGCITAAAALGLSLWNLYDVVSVHTYGSTSGFADYEPPDGYGSSFPMWLLLANFRANMIAKGDTTLIWITEFGWQNASDGPMTAQLQAQYYQNYLVSLSGTDPVNNVLYSSYLKAMCQWAMGSGGANWGIIGSSTATVLAELVTGH